MFLGKDFFDIKINLNNDYNKEDLFNAFISSKYFSFDIFNVDNIKSNDFDLNNILIQFNEFSKKTEKNNKVLNRKRRAKSSTALFLQMMIVQKVF